MSVEFAFAWIALPSDTVLPIVAVPRTMIAALLFLPTTTVDPVALASENADADPSSTSFALTPSATVTLPCAQLPASTYVPSAEMVRSVPEIVYASSAPLASAALTPPSENVNVLLAASALSTTNAAAASSPAACADATGTHIPNANASANAHPQTRRITELSINFLLHSLAQPPDQGLSSLIGARHQLGSRAI